MRRITAFLGLLLFAGVMVGQKTQMESQERIEQTEAIFSGGMTAAAMNSCAAVPSGTGIPEVGILGPGSCASLDPTGTFYAAFFSFEVSAGKTLKISSNSTLILSPISMMYLATIQDTVTRAVLASSGSCGLVQNSCSFIFVVPVSGTYIMGIGSYGTGSFEMTPEVLPPPPSPLYNCTATSTNLCLTLSRFKVTVAWQSPSASGIGMASVMTDATGYFWFFDNTNVELVVKVLDATTINGHFWVFAAGMTNVHTTLIVTDLKTHAVMTYTNPQGTAFQPVQDTLAFTP